MDEVPNKMAGCDGCEMSRLNAILNGVTNNGCWVMSKTPTINQALTDDWLGQQGLLSLKALWIKIHYPTTVR